MAYVAIIYKVPHVEVVAAVKDEERRVEKGLNEAVDKILVLIELAQIHKYTSSSMPGLPAGSRYQRTFNLRHASEIERTGTKLPNISGVWRVNLGKARYGEYVLGSRAEQAKIHRGRWTPRTEVEKEAREKAPQIVEEKLRQ